jgi:phage-related protein
MYKNLYGICMNNPIKVIFCGSSRRDLQAFPEDARREAGVEIWAVQNDEEPANWKPMSTVGAGVREIRIKAEGGAFRVLYVVKIKDAVHILHAFQKKTQQTAQKDIDLAKRRYRETI